jgi:fatty acid amide hydrolase
MTSPVPGQEGIKSTSGPMAKEVDGLVLIMRAIMNDGLMHAMDPTIPNMPFNDAKYPHLPPCSSSSSIPPMDKNKKLRIGWFDTDGFAPPVPSCARAVDEARDALKKRGHELIEFDIATPRIGYESIKLFAQLIGADQGEVLPCVSISFLLFFKITVS